jgi:glycosyltransferase involved in cell wall biosynthesis
MHLCANIVFQNLLPLGIIVRRNFSLLPGEKSWSNRRYRRWQDKWLARRYRMADFFFDLSPFDLCSRLERIFKLGTHFNVEVEAHPINNDEYRFLIDGELMHCAGGVKVARGYLLHSSNHGASVEDGMNLSGMGTNPAKIAGCADSDNSASERAITHISVCICTYKRPLPLKRLLLELSRQETGGFFTFSIVVADNDEAKSAEATVAEYRLNSAVPVKYVVEPKRSIALARNKVVKSAEGEFSAFIDDDEYPTPRWLLTLFKACNNYKVDGVLGPVLRSFDEVPPAWLEKGRFFDRRVNPTGMRVDWREARTGNVLIKRWILAGSESPFRPEFRVGEDQEFFKRKIEEGRVFIWCAEAEVFEVVPPARWKRSYLVRRALLGGSIDLMLPTFGIRSIVKAVIAVPLYALLLPFALLLGQHRFMTLLVSLCYHLGRLLALLGINVVREEYVTD